MTGSRKLRDRLQKAIRKERHVEALRLYEALEIAEPREPRWPHRKGDLLKRLGRKQAAIAAYEKAVDLYAKLGFVARAAAMAKVVLSIDSTRFDVLERVDVDAARKLHRSARGIVTAPGLGIDDDAITQTKRMTKDALPLVRDESVGDEELRFTSPPRMQSQTIELGVSAADVGDRPERGLGALSERPTAQHLAMLPSTPLLTEVPRPIMERLVRESRLVDLENGQSLIDKGTTADALYLLIEGVVELTRSPSDPTVLLSEGDVVGISCLLGRVSYGADVKARGKVRALRISKLLLDRMVAQHPPLADVLLEIVGRRLVATLVRTSPLFAGFDETGRSRVAQMFEVRRASEGTVILEAGKRSDGLYIPMLGQLVAKSPDGEVLGRLKLGRALGQHSMLTRGPSPLTVEAVSDVLVLRMPATRFHQLVSRNPKMVAQLEALARRPSEPTLSLVPGPRKKGA